MVKNITIAAAQTGKVAASGSAEIEEQAQQLLTEAHQNGVELLSFCELFLTPFFANSLEENFDHYFFSTNEPILVRLRERAAQLKIALVLPFAERTTASYFNSAQVIDYDGTVRGIYRKTHMPAYFPNQAQGGTGSFEKFYFALGQSLPVFDVAGTRIGIQICNDRLYPEASRVLALKGAEIIAMPISYSTYSNPEHRRSIWPVALRARAFENGCFVLAANRVGQEGARHHLGKSMIIDPQGEIIKEAGDQQSELVIAEINLDKVRQARKKFPWWRDRRPELYSPLCS